MALEQMRAVLGRRIKPRYTAAINAQLPYLPALKAREEDVKYRSKMYGLGQDRLGELKQQGQTAKRLGYANIGLGAGLGLMKAINAPDIATIGEETALDTVTGGGLENISDISRTVAEADYVPEGAATGLTDYVPDFLKTLYDDTIGSLFDTIGGLFDA